MTGLVVAPCSHAAARYAVMHWHYSRSMPAGKMIRLGVWEDGEFIGVVLVSRGGTQHLGNPYGLSTLEVCELTRIALRDHSAPVTKVVAAALETLRQTSPGLRLVVSFADPAHGHHGGIYQAGNWIYTGTTAPSHGYVAPSGEVLHERVISPTGFKRQFGVYKPVLRPKDCTLVDLPGKHRYLMPLDRAMCRRIAPLAKPYPTRGPGLDSEPPPNRDGGAGATPAVRSTETA